MEFGPSGVTAGEASLHCVQARAALDGGGGETKALTQRSSLQKEDEHSAHSCLTLSITVLYIDPNGYI